MKNKSKSLRPKGPRKGETYAPLFGAAWALIRDELPPEPLWRIALRARGQL